MLFGRHDPYGEKAPGALGVRRTALNVSHELLARLAGENGATWLVAGVIVLAVVVLCNVRLLTGDVAPIWDSADYYRPFFGLLSDFARAGRLLLWDPWINGGSPDFAEPGVGAASPILLLFGLLSQSNNVGFAVYWIAFWVFGGIGMLLLCKHLKAPSWGGLIVALGFVSCGFYTGHGEHTATLYSFSFIPWIVWRFDSALARRSYWASVEAGLLWGLSGLGGYPQLVILDGMLLGLWAMGRLWFEREELGPERSQGWRKYGFSLVALVLTGAVALIVLSPSYWSFLRDLHGYTYRAGFLDRARALHENVLAPAALNSFASPFLYLLDLGPHRVWPETDVSMSNIYIGVLVLVLAGSAMIKYSKWTLWLVAVGTLFLLCSVGWHLPVRGWVYDWVPPTRFFRNPSVFRAYAILIICVLAALGSRKIERGGERSVRERLTVWLVSIVIAGLACHSFVKVFHDAGLRVVSPMPDIYGARRATLIFISIWSAVLLIFYLWWRERLSTSKLARFLVAVAVFDAATSLRISQFTISSSDSAPWMNAMNSRHVKKLELGAAGLNRHLQPPPDVAHYPNDRNLALKDPELANYGPLQNKIFNVFVTDPVLYRIAIGESRMWFSRQAIWAPPSEAWFRIFSKESHVLGRPPLFLHTREEMEHDFDDSSSSAVAPAEERARAAMALVPVTVRLTRYGPNALDLRLNAPADGWLLVTDRWASGWRAKVNAKPSEVLGADFIFRALRVRSGENVVEFRYQAPGYVRLVVLSWSLILVVGICEIWRCRRALALKPPSFRTDSIVMNRG